VHKIRITFSETRSFQEDRDCRRTSLLSSLSLQRWRPVTVLGCNALVGQLTFVPCKHCPSGPGR